ncbi:MAG: phosphotransferase [Gammaproteobacteria bacterium]|nr:phosphotransferase [Gammaproteobacteria bacterium]
MDSRFKQLQDWLKAVAGIHDYEIAPASADASFRRYFRVRFDDTSRIIMDAPPEQEDCHPFIHVSSLMAGIGLHVPVVLRQDLQQGFLLLTDLGDRVYLSELNTDTVERLYGDALQALLRLQSHGAADLPPYDRGLLMNEMELFRQWYLERHLGLQLSEDENATIDAAFTYLADQALQQPRVIVHRDYHSRNLMVSSPNPGILDFQDAVIGPITYDLVSLLRDCYIAWPRTQVVNWVSQYYRQAQVEGLLENVSEAQFLNWFDLMGIQRHLKASGIFARLNYRDGKSGYLKDIPRTLGYVIDVGKDYPALRPFIELVEHAMRLEKA